MNLLFHSIATKATFYLFTLVLNKLWKLAA